MFHSFDKSKLTAQLKMSIERINLLKNKKMNSLKKNKREIAEMLNQHQDEKARIRTEHVVNEDWSIEALEIISLLCELMIERVRLIESEKTCPHDMKEVCTTLIYAADRTGVTELTEVKKQLTYKYGKQFTEDAMANKDGAVNERIVKKLSATPPNASIVLSYMKSIAQEFEVDWAPDETTATMGSRFDSAMPAPTGVSILPGLGTGVTAPYLVTDGHIGSTMGGGAGGAGGAGTTSLSGSSTSSTTSTSADDDLPSVPSTKPGSKPKGGSGGSGGSGGGGGTAMPSAPMASTFSSSATSSVTSSAASAPRSGAAVPEFDELTARFAALKKT